MSVLSKPYFHDEEAAFRYLESVVWQDGTVCPHCGNVDQARLYRIAPNPEKRVRFGLWKCGECRKQFTAKVGTVFEHARIPMHKILQAVYLMACSKKGVSAHQLHRVLEITYRAAWFLAHRIREAMAYGDLSAFGSNGGAVEVDETFIGHDYTVKPKHEKKGRGYAHKHKVLALVDRTTGQARSMVVDDLKVSTLAPIVHENVDKAARLMTDEASHYTRIGREFAEHGVVAHNAGEYGRGDTHTNTIEGYFSIFKRGMKGVYQHCAKKHLHRYLAEFDFRYNHRARLGFDDSTRYTAAIAGVVGKRLTYRRAD